MSAMRLEGREAIEAYISEVGLICLKQENGMEEPSVVCMLPSDIPQIVEWLQHLAAEFPLAQDA